MFRRRTQNNKNLKQNKNPGKPGSSGSSGSPLLPLEAPLTLLTSLETENVVEEVKEGGPLEINAQVSLKFKTEVGSEIASLKVVSSGRPETIANRGEKETILNRGGPLISYCTTVYNRFWQLKQVIKHNLTIINNFQPAEWIIVDFGGKDSPEISDWLLQNCSQSLEKGTLKYFRRDATLPDFIWNVSQAKNIAHRLATGQVLINLDGDNFLQNKDPQIIRNLFLKNPNLLLHQTWNNFLIKYNIQRLGRGRSIVYRDFLPNFSGSNGRISMAQQHFIALGGYDEEMLFMGFQDTDLLTRGVLAGLKYLVKEPIEGGARQQQNKGSNGPAQRASQNELRSSGPAQRASQNELRSSGPAQRASQSELRSSGPRGPLGVRSNGLVSSSTFTTGTGRILRVANRSRIRTRGGVVNNAGDRKDFSVNPFEINPRAFGTFGTPRAFSSVGTPRAIGAFTPFKGESTDSVSNQRSRPYSNNKVKSWKEAEHYNRSLSQRKIRQGKLRVNLDGFQLALEDYHRKLTSNTVASNTVVNRIC